MLKDIMMTDIDQQVVDECFMMKDVAMLHDQLNYQSEEDQLSVSECIDNQLSVSDCLDDDVSMCQLMMSEKQVMSWFDQDDTNCQLSGQVMGVDG